MLILVALISRTGTQFSLNLMSATWPITPVTHIRWYDAELPNGAESVGFDVRGKRVAYSPKDRKLTALGSSAPLEMQDGRIVARCDPCSCQKCRVSGVWSWLAVLAGLLDRKIGARAYGESLCR